MPEPHVFDDLVEDGAAVTVTPPEHADKLHREWMLAGRDALAAGDGKRAAYCYGFAMWLTSGREPT